MSTTDWEARYQTGDMPWEKGAPSPGLVDFLAANPQLGGSDALVAASSGIKLNPEIQPSATGASLPPLTVCVPGCGTGHDVREWAKAGFQVYGYDLAPSAIRLSVERTQAAGLQAEFRLVDFLRDEPPFLFDWLFEHTLFCAIDPSEREQYVQAVLRWLKPGGQYLAVNYLIPDRDGPPFGTTREELIERFAPHFSLLSEWVPRSYPNRTGLELMMRWRKNQMSVENETGCG
jgi:SAM-dependent methyltransferase